MSRREVKVLKCLSELGEGTAEQVAERLAAGSRMTRWRVHATLADLRRRGLLEAWREDHATTYRALVEWEELPGRSLARVIARFTQRSTRDLTSPFVEPTRLASKATCRMR